MRPGRARRRAVLLSGRARAADAQLEKQELAKLVDARATVHSSIKAMRRRYDEFDQEHQRLAKEVAELEAARKAPAPTAAQP